MDILFQYQLLTNLVFLQYSSIAQLCLTLCDPKDCSTPGFPSITKSWSLFKFMSIKSVDTIQPSNPPSSPLSTLKCFCTSIKMINLLGGHTSAGSFLDFFNTIIIYWVMCTYTILSMLTQWTWIRASSRRQWSTGKPGVLQSMGSQRVGHDWATEQLEYYTYESVEIG